MAKNLWPGESGKGAKGKLAGGGEGPDPGSFTQARPKATFTVTVGSFTWRIAWTVSALVGRCGVIPTVASSSNVSPIHSPSARAPVDRTAAAARRRGRRTPRTG